MRKVEIERTAIVKALHRAPNITVAARDLGASRRTLQARMRDHGIPRGKAGRPRTLLPRSRFERVDEGALALAVIGVIGVGLYLWRRRKQEPANATVVGAAPAAPRSPALAGLDIIVSLT